MSDICGDRWLETGSPFKESDSMSDNDMCLNKRCPSFTRCKRAQSAPKKKQIYSNFKVKKSDLYCDSFIEMKINGKLH